MTPFEVLYGALLSGGYTFCFALDGNMDDNPDVTRLDSVEVTVE